MISKEHNVHFINKFYKMAMDESVEITDQRELLNRDLTEAFYDEFKKIIDAGELLNIQINGRPGSGKSLAMIALVVEANRLLKKDTKICYILPNQILHTAVMRHVKKPLYICIGIDEYDALGGTGHDSTINLAAGDHYSDLHRANYIHKIACSPSEQIDKNASFILDIPDGAADKERKVTRAFLSYKIGRGGATVTPLLGFIDIPVGHILDMQLYKDYEQHKMRRLQLHSKYGFRHEHDIFLSCMAYDAYRELEPMLRAGCTINRGLIDSAIEGASIKNKIMVSILTKTILSERLSGLFKLLSEQNRARKHIYNIKKTPLEKMTTALEMQKQGYIDTLKLLYEQEEAFITKYQKAEKLKKIFFGKYEKAFKQL